MNHESRPQAASADSTPIKSSGSIVPPNPLAELSIGRRMWARRYIERRTSRVVYGSTEWLTLANDDPNKIAACVAAAECWATAGDTLEADLRRDIELMRAAHKRRDDEEYQQQADGHRSKYGNPPTGRSFQERRAEQLAAASPKSTDYQGGPVDWNGGAS